MSPPARTLVSYKLPKTLHRELRRVSKAVGRDMTGIVEEALVAWLVEHRFIGEGGVAGTLDSSARERRRKIVHRVSRLSQDFPEKHPGRSHDDVLYGDVE